MDKEKILEKSRKENLNGDERDRDIENKAYKVGFYSIVAIFGMLTFITWIQNFIKGNSFADMKIFSMGFLIALAGEELTKYIYYRNRKQLIIGLFFALAAIANLVLIIVGYR
ncbi:DUF6442 family protein [Clostridium cochlearium]|uniref:DUF6442 family protein n=1 Tax=Clostridium cochlearium TaxID=1494 RepID=UPI0021499FDB|nr:DUF6442 family protein [Clostridium cochlearium]MCR1971835.1 DUF6442 family protein [Clostridium cochlearium]